jgi:hypothetical protein
MNGRAGLPDDLSNTNAFFRFPGHAIWKNNYNQSARVRHPL